MAALGKASWKRARMASCRPEASVRICSHCRLMPTTSAASTAPASAPTPFQSRQSMRDSMVLRPALRAASRSSGALRTGGTDVKSSLVSDGMAATFMGERHSCCPSQTLTRGGGGPISLPDSSALAVSRWADSLSPAAQPVPVHSPVRTVRLSSETSTVHLPSSQGSTS